MLLALWQGPSDTSDVCSMALGYESTKCFAIVIIINNVNHIMTHFILFLCNQVCKFINWCLHTEFFQTKTSCRGSGIER